MLKFPERLNKVLDEVVELALAEYKGEKKIKDKDWAAKMKEFKDARHEFTYGPRESKVNYDFYAGEIDYAAFQRAMAQLEAAQARVNAQQPFVDQIINGVRYRVPGL